jgi:putative heme-binding domain-containing protein
MVKDLLESARNLAQSGQEQPWVRVLAAEAVIKAGAPAAPDLVLTLLDSSGPLELQVAAARGLVYIGGASLAARVMERWGILSLAVRRTLPATLAQSSTLASPLIEAVERGDVSPIDIDPAALAALRRTPDLALRARVEALVKRARPLDRREVLSRYAAALERPADVARGADLFARNCQACHQLRGRGQQVGPDLSGVTGRPKDTLLIDILDPNRDIVPDYVNFVLVNKSGQVLTGIVAEETATSIRLRRAEGAEDIILRTEIAELRSTCQSLMPVGLEQALSVPDVADLIGFLKQGDPP